MRWSVHAQWMSELTQLSHRNVMLVYVWHFISKWMTLSRLHSVQWIRISIVRFNSSLFFFWCCFACVLYNSPPINKIVDSLIDEQMIIRSIIRWNGHSTHKTSTPQHTRESKWKKQKRNKRIRKLGQFQFNRILFLLFNDLSRKLTLYNRNDIVDYIDCLFRQMNWIQKL